MNKEVQVWDMVQYLPMMRIISSSPHPKFMHNSFSNHDHATAS